MFSTGVPCNYNPGDSILSQSTPDILKRARISVNPCIMRAICANSKSSVIFLALVTRNSVVFLFSLTLVVDHYSNSELSILSKFWKLKILFASDGLLCPDFSGLRSALLWLRYNSNSFLRSCCNWPKCLSGFHCTLVWINFSLNFLLRYNIFLGCVL